MVQESMINPIETNSVTGKNMAVDSPTAAKLSGYLEKKGKLRMVSSWKKYWFVLEGRLLLYYRSRAEYDAISPCKGSISLGPPCNIKPTLASSCVFQLETRSNTITLRAENRLEQDKWMQAILAALNQTSSSPSKMSHFRYSADDLVPTPTGDNQKPKLVLCRQNTLPERLTKSNTPQPSKPLIERLQTLGAHTYGGSLQTINKLANKSPNLPKNENLKRLLQSASSDNMYAQIEKSTKEVLVENSHYGSIRNVTRESVLVENEQYISAPTNQTQSTGNTRGKENIYQEIDDRVTVENPAYCSVDHNKNNTYAEPVTKNYDTNKIYDVPIELEPSRTKIYEELDIEPDLPPRPQPDEDDLKPKRNGKLKLLASAVREGKKDGKKRNSFVIRILKRMRKDGGSKVEEVEKPVVQVEASSNEVMILNELQKLLDNKKNVIEERLKSTSSNDDVFVGKQPNKNEAHHEYMQILKEDKDTTPTLPPKQKHSPTPALIVELNEYNTNALNIPRPKLIMKSKKHARSSENMDEKLKTIDEILDDLEVEKSEQACRQKVKDLIEKFNEASSSDEVEMRNKDFEVTAIADFRDSDELNRLLDELCKVTNAPILLPGATCSLVTTGRSDEEWDDLASIRKRRLSEPDYDIPRPHSSLQIIPTIDNSEDNPMKPTRFFGPVLLDRNRNNGDTNEKQLSITPDSLEIEHIYQNRHICASSIEEDRSLFSYTSHNYGGEMKTLDRKLTMEDIYSRPKSFTNPLPLADENVIQEDPEISKPDEYQDSLELTEHLQSSMF